MSNMALLQVGGRGPSAHLYQILPISPGNLIWKCQSSFPSSSPYHSMGQPCIQGRGLNFFICKMGTIDSAWFYARVCSSNGSVSCKAEVFPHMFVCQPDLRRWTVNSFREVITHLDVSLRALLIISTQQVHMKYLSKIISKGKRND